MSFTYPYPRPSVTCDVVVFAMRGDELSVLLVRRQHAPFQGRWAFPGGYVNENESLERAALRELREETGLSVSRIEQIGAFGNPGRDPRGHTITVAYSTFLLAPPAVHGDDDAEAAEWHSIDSLSFNADKASGLARRHSTGSASSVALHLAFDHSAILAVAYRRLCRHLEDPVHDRSFDLFASRFTLSELRHTYEVVLRRSFSPRAFKQMLDARGLVVPASSIPAKKPAEQLYRWNRPRG